MSEVINNRFSYEDEVIEFRGKRYIVDYKRIFIFLGFIFGIGLVLAMSEKPVRYSHIEYLQLIISNSGFIDWLIIGMLVFFACKTSIWEVDK